MKSIEIYQVDAFASKAFEGNPAAVCITSEPLEEQLMQKIAEEMNLSETAFAVALEPEALYPAATKQQERVQGHYSLRWFTPAREVSLCGHATLATAKILFDIEKIEFDTISFATQSGKLMVTKKQLFCLDFPIDIAKTIEAPKELAQALETENIEECLQSERMKKMLVRLKSAEHVRKLKPNFSALLQIEKDFGNMGFIVTASDKEYDFISRYFVPSVGIDEDPVTGAAHTVLAPYWAQVLGKNNLTAFQASARGGKVNLELHEQRVNLIGDAVVVLKGQLMLDD